jgi:HEAT repeat protein
VDELILALIYLLFVGGAIWAKAWKLDYWFSDLGKSRDIPPASRLQIWHGAATACGLSLVESPNPWVWRLKLETGADPIEARFEGINSGTRAVVVIPGPPGFGGVEIRRQEGEPGADEFEIGDEVFDGAFSLTGPARLLCVLLDAEARRLLRRVDAKSQVEIVRGEIRAEMIDVEVPFILPFLLDLARRFAQKVDIVQCLVDNAQRDPEAGVRLSNLLFLVRECAWSPRTVEALRTACKDPSPRVRLRAAIELGPEGRGVLLELAESTEDECAAQAIRALGRELPIESATTILGHALNGHRIQTACACLEVLGGSGTAGVDALAAALAREERAVAIAAAQALGMTASAAAEPPLIQALHRNLPDLRVAAARALGRVGSATAVLPLKEAAEPFPSDSWLDPDLRRAAYQAIAEIQSRLTGATPGQLSLTGAETGQLSLAQTEGQLSLATDWAGQLSLHSEEAGRLSLSGEEEGGKPVPGGDA